MQGKYNAVGLYDDAADPRIIVPKRNPAFGWTLNIAHRSGWTMLVAIAVLVLIVSVIALAR